MSYTTTSLGPDTHTTMALRTYEDIVYQNSYYYHFLGRTHAWNDADAPDGIEFSAQNDTEIRDSMVYIKRIYPNDISLAIPRYEWQAPNGITFFGEVYDQWDHTVDMSVDKKFYCVTVPEYNVFKCLYNNNGSLSTSKPTSTSLTPLKSDDGYVWKYMYTIPPFKTQRFISEKYIPVQRALSDLFYNKGAIEQIVVNNPGSGYSRTRVTSLRITDSSDTPTPAEATVSTVAPLSGAITGISLDANLLKNLNYISGGPGPDGSTYASVRVGVNSSTGQGAEIRALLDTASKKINGFEIVEGGFGYTDGDPLTFTVRDAELIPIINSDGSIINVYVETGGYGYSSTNTTIAVVGGDDSVVNAVISPTITNGTITGVTISNSGRNYSSASDVTISSTGDGTGAKFLPIVSSTGNILAVAVDSPGKNYSWISLTVADSSSSPGSGASLSGVINSSDFESSQAIVEQDALKNRGAIYAIVITNTGLNNSHETPPAVTITGDGKDCAAKVILVNKYISHIEVTNPGSGYTYANVSITAAGENSPDSTFRAYAVLPPLNGHGYDAPTELFAKTLSIYGALYEDPNISLLSVDYRQHGILSNPMNTLTGERIRVASELLLYDVSFAFTGDATFDATVQKNVILSSNGRLYRILNVDSVNKSLKLQQLSSIYSVPSNSFKNEDTLTAYSVKSINNIPKTNKYSGRLFYVSNDYPFSPTDTQYIVIKSFIEF